ncbi:hypothetical protein [Aquipuribacter sp. MA13-6]|uniref:hypothetical protein n=1 Tax=unclassified Aquipuribacter TaxID=2635084 RepID=UPI003EEAB8F4
MSLDPPEPTGGTDGQPPVTPAVRLIFTYDGDEVRLLQQQPVDVAVTGFDVDQPAPLDGHVVEVRADDGSALARVVVRSGPPTSAEVFPEQPGEPIVRVEAPTTGAFTVVVPAPEAAARITLLRVTPAPEADVDADARAESGDGAAPPPGDGAPSVATELGTYELER